MISLSRSYSLRITLRRPVRRTLISFKAFKKGRPSKSFEKSNSCFFKATFRKVAVRSNRAFAAGFPWGYRKDSLRCIRAIRCLGPLCMAHVKTFTTVSPCFTAQSNLPSTTVVGIGGALRDVISKVMLCVIARSTTADMNYHRHGQKDC